MNAEWSEKNKRMQSLLKKSTFPEGIRELLELRELLMQEILSWKNLPNADFCAIPYLNSDGYHSKTVAYSLWHIFRIEDIVVNSLIRKETEVLFQGGYVQALNTPIITTGNELRKMEIADFSQKLNIDVLYRYIEEVRQNTDAWLMTLDYPMLKKGFDEKDAERLRSLHVVSEDEEAQWLIAYWCGKDIKGLIQMPLSRHWIMHIEAARRILAKIQN